MDLNTYKTAVRNRLSTLPLGPSLQGKPSFAEVFDSHDFELEPMHAGCGKKELRMNLLCKDCGIRYNLGVGF